MYKLYFFVKNFFEVIMKAKWKDEEIKSLFNLIEKNNKKNKSMLDSFREYASITKRNALSVRNFYYTYAKILKENVELQKKLDIDISKHIVQKFEHFDRENEEKIKNQINNLKKSGISTRSACLKLSNGDIKNMLRLQNKYRNIEAKERKEAEIIKFPTYNLRSEEFVNNSKTKLTDDEIKSLFLGLVKLVKESAKSDSQEKAQKFLEQTEENKRKRLVEIEEQKAEIERLKEVVLELKTKNKFLNKQLEDYRIDYVNNIDPKDRIYQ